MSGTYDIEEQRVRIIQMIEETEKFIAEQHKLRAEDDKLRAEGNKLRAEGDKFNLERWLLVVGAVGGVAGLLAAGTTIVRTLGQQPAPIVIQLSQPASVK